MISSFFIRILILLFFTFFFEIGCEDETLESDWKLRGRAPETHPYHIFFFCGCPSSSIHLRSSLSHLHMVCFPKRSTRQCAPIWSDNLQLPCWRFYEIRQPPNFLCTTFNFLTNTTFETLQADHMGRHLATHPREK